MLAKVSRPLFFWGALLLVVAPSTSRLAAQTPDLGVRRPRSTPDPDLVKALERRGHFAGEDDPNVTLDSVLAKWAKASGVKYSFDEQAFRDEKLEDVREIKLGQDPLRPMKNVTH